MERNLNVVPTLTDAIVIGTKNAASLLLVILLYVITLWIPYINVGTTIALASIPGKLAKGEIINPLFIFDSVYRQKMGDFFLLEGFLLIMLIPAFMFMYIPGIVLSIMYSLALYIMVDTDVAPNTALKLSDKATKGYKWKIFGVTLLYLLVLSVAFAIIIVLVALIDVDILTCLVVFALMIVAISCGLALDAVIYRNLFLNVQEPISSEIEQTIEEVEEISNL